MSIISSLPIPITTSSSSNSFHLSAFFSNPIHHSSKKSFRSVVGPTRTNFISHPKLSFSDPAKLHRAALDHFQLSREDHAAIRGAYIILMHHSQFEWRQITELMLMVVAIRGVVVGRVEDRELVKFVGISLETLNRVLAVVEEETV